MNGPTANAGFTYNGLGDRLTQTVEGETTTYTLDLNAGLTQVLSDGDTTYLYGLARLSQETVTPGTGALDTGYYLGDALGSVRQLTGNTGAVDYVASYTPYGEVLSSAGEGESVYGYVGEATDVTGLIFLRARFYAPWDGRFVTRDTWGGVVSTPLSYNRWLYSYARPTMLVDRTGLDPNPCTDTLVGLINCSPYQSEEPYVPKSLGELEQYRYTKPSGVWFIGSELSSPRIIDSHNPAQAQFISNYSDYAKEHNWPIFPHSPDNLHTGLCGLISVAALLNSVYPGGISVNEVVDDFLSYNEYFDTVRLEAYPDAQTMDELHDFINLSYYAYLTAYSKVEKSMPVSDVRNWLSQGSYAIVGVRCGRSYGLVSVDGGADHWVVVTGISYQWDDSDASSPWNWVRVYNSFTNKTEYYPWSYFKPAQEGFAAGAPDVMRVDTHSPSLNQMLRYWSDCDIPEYVRRRLR